MLFIVVTEMGMKDFERNSEPSYKQMAQVYNEWFTLGYLPGMQLRLALINLVGWLVYELRKKKPDVTFYQIVNKLAEGTGLEEMDIKKIAIIAEDFSYNCTDYLDFGLKIKDVPAKIKEIMGKMLPF